MALCRKEGRRERVDLAGGGILLLVGAARGIPADAATPPLLFTHAIPSLEGTVGWGCRLNSTSVFLAPAHLLLEAYHRIANTL